VEPSRAPRPLSRRDLLRLGLRGTGVVVAAGPLSAILASCGDDTPEGGGPSPAAPGLTRADIESASGTVKVLSWEWYEVPESQPPGITAEWAYLTTNEDTITKTTQPGSFDVVGIFQGEIDQLRLLDRIAPIDTSLLENFAGMNPLFAEAEVIRRDGQVFAVPFQWGYAYITYDRRQTDAPTSLDDLMASSLRGKIGVPDDPYAVITTFAKLAGFSEPNSLTPEQFQQTIDLMNEFKPQLRTVYVYGEAPQLLGQKDIAIALPEFGPTFTAAQDAGADATFTLVAGWSYVDCLMVLREATNVAGAFAYIDRSITPEAQAAVSAQGLAFPVVDSAVTALPKAMRYGSPDEILAEAPLLPGPPVDDSGGFVPFQEWLTAWQQFKS
jgi:spermidine/putrescine transport system substrate-binding protein